ncbi:MAG: 3-deoxy-7-phosphoheptulonate synthase, partial [Betaproteobacteria bacterium AqS2]|nr:3-deoxy-7-phosphoheptulonate synthase [Betaproteobacteria bacterium AqS2]
GNPDTHVILRGGTTGPNYDAKSVAAAAELLESKGLPRPVMVDCSHANSAKDHKKQLLVAADLAGQLQAGGADLMGVMIESHLVEGRQDHEAGKELVYGQSITDACLGWDETATALEQLAAAVAARRAAKSKT